jgi:ankyrin repeat protein
MAQTDEFAAQRQALLAAPWPALHQAIVDGRYDAVSTLLSSGEDVNATAPTGHTPLFLAVSGSDAEVALDLVDLLLAAGAVLGDVLSLEGELHRTSASVLHAAVKRNHTEVAARLLAAGASAAAAAEQGMTPLHLARSAPMVELLVAAGACIDAADMAGMQPLHHAILDVLCPSEAVQALLRAGANADCEVTVNGKTATARTLAKGAMLNVLAVEDARHLRHTLETRPASSGRSRI